MFYGDAPDVDGQYFFGTSPDCKVWVCKESSGWDVDIPGIWRGLPIDYMRGPLAGETATFGDVSSAYECWGGDAINESNFDFCIPASYRLPAGTVVRIKEIVLASLNTSFTQWDATTNKSDPYYLYLNGVRSDSVNRGSEALGDDIVISVGDKSYYALTYTFSTPCDVVVGKRYPAVTGNSIGKVGNGLALLHSNGNLLYGSGADRASVLYVKSEEDERVITTTTAKSVTGEDGYAPVYEIVAEVVSGEELAFDYTAEFSNHTILFLENGWFNGATYFAGGTPQNSLLRIGPSERFKFALQTTLASLPYYNVPARAEPFSFALYADVSQMPSNGKAIMTAFGHDGGNILALYRNRAEVALALVNPSGEIIGDVAAVADCVEGFHLYVATCDPETGDISLSVDGGGMAYGGTDGGVALGTGFQIGSVYGKMRRGFTYGAGMAIVKMLGYNDILSAETIAQLSTDYPYALGGSFCQDAGIGALPVLWRSDAVFRGWFTEAEGGARIEPSMIPVSGLTLYAQWLLSVATPIISPGDGTEFRADSCVVSISCDTEGATIYYSTDGTTPTIDESHRYTGPFAISETTSVKAIAIAGELNYNMLSSESVHATIAQHWLTMEEAVDADFFMNITTSETDPWFPLYDAEAKLGDASVRSWAIGDRTNTWLVVQVLGAGTMTFWCKTSCEHDEDNAFTWDRLMVYTNDIEIVGWRMDGETDWTKRVLSFGDGVNTVKLVYSKDRTGADGEDCAWVDAFAWAPNGGDVVEPLVEGDDMAIVTGDSESGYTVKPSEGKKDVVVTIPDGVAADKVTVEVAADVETVTANGANVRVMKGEHDIAEHLDLEAVTQDGVINLASAQVKEEVVKEALDTEKGAEVDISDPDSPELTTSETKPGLTYTLLEGETLEAMMSCTDGDSKVGDGEKWTPEIKVKGGTSGFYTIKVEK